MPDSHDSLIQQAVTKTARLSKRLGRSIFPGSHVVNFIDPEKASPAACGLRNFQVLEPAAQIALTDPLHDPFTRVSKYYRDGIFDRPNIYTCEVGNAYLHVGSGLVFTHDFQAIPDLEYRFRLYSVYHQRKPRKVTPLAGLSATINSCYGWSHFSWYVDCLARLHSLARAVPRLPLKLIMPDNLHPVGRESLECLLPPHFKLVYYPPDTWLRLESCVWPSLVTGRCNGFLPREYYEAIRQPIFARFGLPPGHTPRDRLYVTRRSASSRRVINETAVLALLAPFGFRVVEAEKLSFRQQVELFHGAEIVAGPHGAGIHLIGYSGAIRVLVLHPNRVPQNFFHTLARGLGQEYHFVLTADEGSEERDFEVDLAALQHVLTHDLKLTANS